MTRNDANDELPQYTFTPPDTHGGRLAGRLAGAWIEVEGGDLPCPIAVRLGSGPHRRRLFLTGLRVGAPDGSEEYEITARMLRDVRLGNVLRAVREGLHGVSGTALDDQAPGEPLAFTLGELVGLTALERPPDVRVRRGPKGLDPETLRRTAEAYRDVLAAGSTQPLAAVAQRLDIHPSTVWRRLQTAWRRFPDLDPRGGKP